MELRSEEAVGFAARGLRTHFLFEFYPEEKKMKRRLLLMVLSLAIAASAAGPAIAGGPAKVQSLNPSEMGQPVVVKGKIAFMQNLGGYTVNGEDPFGEFMIVNQDRQWLGTLLKNGKKVTIEGRLRGAEFLFIEKIDGKPYSGKAASK
jgi:hypothetical protein